MLRSMSPDFEYFLNGRPLENSAMHLPDFSC
ncbi:DUF4184 family protein [Mesobacillus zeae]|nr:DUF4184 family protein [Mesobacillus zeae]